MAQTVIPAKVGAHTVQLPREIRERLGLVRNKFAGIVPMNGFVLMSALEKALELKEAIENMNPSMVIYPIQCLREFDPEVYEQAKKDGFVE